MEWTPCLTRRSVGRSVDQSVGRSVESIGRSVGRIGRSVGRSNRIESNRSRRDARVDSTRRRARDAIESTGDRIGDGRKRAFLPRERQNAAEEDGDERERARGEMEEVFGTFWREVLGEESDSSEDAREDSGDSVRIVRRASEEGTRVWGATSERLRGIDKRTFVGIVKVEEADSAEAATATLVDVLHRTGGGRTMSSRVRAEDGHRGFLGRVLEAWMRTMVEEEVEANDERAETTRTTTTTTRGGARALAKSGEWKIKMELKTDAKSDIMTNEQMKSLREALPGMYRTRAWSLAYSTKRDGTSLKSLYRRSSGKGVTVLVVRDGGGAIFGAFCTEAWKVHARYVGTGESFVFTLAPEGMKYAWSGENDYYMFGAADSLSVGGGSAHAIRLEEDLLQGSSGECETFQSPSLASENMFRTSRIELWALE